MEEIFCEHCFSILQAGCAICPACHRKVGHFDMNDSRDLLVKVLHQSNRMKPRENSGLRGECL